MAICTDGRAITRLMNHKIKCEGSGGKLAEFKTVQEFLGIWQFTGQLTSSNFKHRLSLFILKTIEIRTYKFFIGLEAKDTIAAESVQTSCNTNLETCGAVLTWPSDGSNFVVDTTWMKPTLFRTEEKGRCTFVNPATKQISIVSCNSQYRALCQITCKQGKQRTALY